MPPNRPAVDPRERVPYDAVLKDLFQQDRPCVLDSLTGGLAVVQTLNVELAEVTEQRADLLFLLENGTLLHLDFQSQNDPDMAYRVGVHGLMNARKYRLPIRQVAPTPGRRMPADLDAGDIRVSYPLKDILQRATRLPLARRERSLWN